MEKSQPEDKDFFSRTRHCRV